MIKSLNAIIRQDKEKFRVPRSVQDAITVRTIWKNGIFLVGNNKYSKTFQFTDINYGTASDEDKKTMFLAYSELLNSFDSNTTTKITIMTRKLKERGFERDLLMPMMNVGKRSISRRIRSQSCRKRHKLCRSRRCLPTEKKRFPKRSGYTRECG